MSKWKYGDEVMVPVLVPALLKGQTNEREPTGNWWVLLHGENGLRAVHENEFRKLKD